MNMNEQFLVNLFSDSQKFFVGQELNKLMQDRLGVTSEVARKTLQRVVKKGLIRSSAPLTFGKGQYAYFNSGQSLSHELVQKLSEKFRPPLYRLLALLQITKGVVSYLDALKVTGTPISRSSSKAETIDNIVVDLVKAKLIETYVEEEIKYIVSTEFGKIEHCKDYRNRMVLDCMFLPDIQNWLVKSNIIDNSRVVFRNKSTPALGAQHNNYIWDAFAYSKTTGLHTALSKSEQDEKGQDVKNTLVVLDCLIHREYNMLDLSGFYDRIQGTRCSTKIGTRKVLPIVIAKQISDKALKQIRSYGFMVFNLGTIYGEKIYNVIQNLEKFKINSSAIFLPENIHYLTSALESLSQSGHEENLGNLKGALFEWLLFPLIKVIYPSAIIRQGRTLKNKKEIDSKSVKKKIEQEYYEYDYIVEDSNEFIVIECKGRPGSRIPLGTYKEKDTVRWFFNRTLPFAKNILHSNSYFQKKVVGCYITAGKFEDDALLILKEKINIRGNKPRNLESYYDGDGLKALLMQENLMDVLVAIEKFFSPKP